MFDFVLCDFVLHYHYEWIILLYLSFDLDFLLVKNFQIMGYNYLHMREKAYFY